MAITLPSVPSSFIGFTNTATTGPNAFPWEVSNITSAFFPSMSLDNSLWDELLTYRLLVIDTANGNQVVNGGDPSDIQALSLGGNTISIRPLSTTWELQFPITPQQLSISDQYAIRTSATLKGVLEQHSGTRFKNISIQGTFGVWPGRPAIVSPPGTPSP